MGACQSAPGKRKIGFGLNRLFETFEGLLETLQAKTIEVIQTPQIGIAGNRVQRPDGGRPLAAGQTQCRFDLRTDGKCHFAE